MKNRILFQCILGFVAGIMMMQCFMGLQGDVRPVLVVLLASGLVLIKGQRLWQYALGILCGLIIVPLHFFLIQQVPVGLWQSSQISGVIQSTSTVSNSAVIIIKGYTENEVWKQAKAHVKLYGVVGVKAGERVVLKGKFRSLMAAANPYGYDQRQSFYAKGLQGMFYVYPNGIVSKEAEGGIFAPFLSIRENWLRKIENASQYGGYWIGFVLGEEEAIPEDALKLIRRTGLAHVLAVSGLHVGIVYGFVAFLVQKFMKKRAFQDGVIIMVLILYLGVNLLSFTVLRAVALVLYHRIGFYGARRPDSVTAIGVIAGLDLLFNSFDLFDLSFLLSIGATLSIAFLYRCIHGKLRFLGETLSSSLGIIFSAQIGVLPIQLYVFNVFYPESVIFNLLFVPIFSIAICVAFVFSLFSVVPLMLPILVLVFDGLMGLVENTLYRVAGILSFPLYMTGLSIICCIAVAVWLCAFFQGFSRKTVGVLSGLCVLFTMIQMTMSYESFKVMVFSTGKSDAMVIQHQGHHYMIDTATGKVDFGLLLLKNDIHKLDALIITHDDADHSGGMVAVQDKIKIKQLIQGLKGPQTIGDQDLKLDLFYGAPGMSDNDNSIVTMLTHGDFKMLFMGDAEIKREELLEQEGLLEAVDVIKIGHHGSNTSTGQEMLSMTQPKIALICSDGSKYFPRQDVLDRLLECDIMAYRTDLSGCIELTVVKQGIQIHEYSRTRDEL